MYLRLLATISQMAQRYGANAQITADDHKEMAIQVRDNFGWIGINEIPIAFRLCYAGELNINAEMYYGKFHAGTMSKILAAYRDYRSKATKALDAAAEAEFIEAREKAKKEYHEQHFFRLFERAAKNVTSWKECFEFWYNILERRGIIKPTRDEKLKAYDKAKELEKQILREELSNSKDPIERGKNLSILESVMAGEPKSAATIAKKLIVYEYIVCVYQQH